MAICITFDSWQSLSRFVWAFDLFRIVLIPGWASLAPEVSRSRGRCEHLQYFNDMGSFWFWNLDFSKGCTWIWECQEDLSREFWVSCHQIMRIMIDPSTPPKKSKPLKKDIFSLQHRKRGKCSTVCVCWRRGLCHFHRHCRLYLSLSLCHVIINCRLFCICNCHRQYCPCHRWTSAKCTSPDHPHCMNHIWSVISYHRLWNISSLFIQWIKSGCGWSLGKFKTWIHCRHPDNCLLQVTITIIDIDKGHKYHHKVYITNQLIND